MKLCSCCLTLAFAAALTVHISPCQAQQKDWPTVQGNNARHGWSRCEPAKAYRLRWYWTHEKTFATRDLTDLPARDVARINRMVQPVVSDGRVYFGSINGTFYCLDLQTGRELWRKATAGPINYAGAVAQGRAVFTSGDGKIYACDAATGQTAWSFQTGAALMVAPLIADGTVYVGSRDGLLYAIHLESGKAKWKYQSDAPILCTAATDGRRIFLANEAGRFIALNPDTGRPLWTRQTQLGSTRHYWPVVAGDSVIFRASSISVNAEHCQARSLLGKHSDMPWARVEPMLIELLKNHPEEETFFVLDAGTGTKRFTAPVGLLSRHGDTPPPPVVNPEGDVYTWFLTTESSMRRMGFGSLTSHDVGRLDLETGRIRSPMPEDARARHLRNCTDDYNFLTGAGSFLCGHHTRPTMLMPLVETATRKPLFFVPQWGGVKRVPFESAKLPQRRPLIRYGQDRNLGRGYSSLVVLDGVVLVNLFGRRNGIACWEAVQ
jgi:outer membrane protein assembly factor BamB